jgi:cytochrome c553
MNQGKWGVKKTFASKSDAGRGRSPGLCLSLSLVVAAAGCSSIDRTRALGDADTPAKTIALQVCSNCHGVQGISTSPNFPILAAQSQTYLVEQLNSFKSHGRADPPGFEYMWGVSAHLSEDQIRGLAAYFAALPAAPGKAAPPSLVEQGRHIYEQANTANNMPACASFHGVKAEGGGQFPRLAGQHADYTIKQLLVFQRTDQRPGGAVMKSITHGLAPENMASVAAFLEAGARAK